MKKEITICLAGLVLAVSCILSGCSAKNKATPASFDASDYVRISEMTEAGDNPEAFAASYEPIKNLTHSLAFLPILLSMMTPGSSWTVITTG